MFMTVIFFLLFLLSVTNKGGAMPSPYVKKFDGEDDPRLANAKVGDVLIDNHGNEVEVDQITEKGEACSKGTILHNGRIAPGNKMGRGRKKGSRNKLNQNLLDFMANSEVEIGPALVEMYMSEQTSPKEKIQCLKILSDIVFPKSQSVEVEIIQEEKSKDQIQNELALKLAALQALSK